MADIWAAAPPRQCAWCGQALDGLSRGTLFFRVDGQGIDLHRLDGYSHGICQTCRHRNAGRRKLLRQRASTDLRWA